MNDPFLADMSKRLKEINRKQAERLQDEDWWEQMNNDAKEIQEEDT